MLRMARLSRYQIRAFSLLESLVTLAVTAFLVLSLSGGVGQIFKQVEEELFFLSFEHLYRDSQKLAASQQKQLTLSLSQQEISNGQTSLALPATVTLDQPLKLTFNQAGGNSSLAKIRFQASDKEVTYQLYIGSGRYQKKEH